jgi:hypothetical protein
LSCEIFRGEIEENGYKLSATLLRLDNSVMAFFDEKGSIKLGTLAIAMPQPGGKTYLSSILLGDRNIVTTKILAGHFSNAFNCISLVSTHLAHIEERRGGSLLLKLAQKLVDKAS